MIATITGTIEDIGDKYVVVATGGIGYKIFVTKTSLENFKIDESVKFFTKLHVRENAQDLYGFLIKPELTLFEQLISVSGVGPSHALNIISTIGVDAIVAAIIKNDAKFITQIPGIGRKISEKIIIDLKEKLIKTGISPKMNLLSDSDAYSALIALGYSESQARKSLSEVSDKITTIEGRIKEALKILNRKAPSS